MVKHFLATTALSVALVLPAVSQETPAPDPGTQGGVAAPGAVAPEQPLPPLTPVDLAGMTADQVIGSSVVNANEETLGTVDDAVLGADGKIEKLVVSFGGFLGFGAKTVELPMDQIEIMSRGEGPHYAVTDLTPEALEAMPAFERE